MNSGRLLDVMFTLDPTCIVTLSKKYLDSKDSPFNNNFHCEAKWRKIAVI